jgi:NAD-dependent deacetylase
MEHEDPLDRAADALAGASACLVLTGAGISLESGIPTFRGPGGLWEGFRAEELATPEAFAMDPARVWRWYRWRAAQYGDCLPNPGHETIARMEGAFDRFLLATQNVDGLHPRAGSTRMVELHGTITKMRCTSCSLLAPFPGPATEGEDPVPVCTACTGRMRPHILWFGEQYWPGVLEEAMGAARQAEVVLVAGTSGQVWPPAMLALEAARRGAFLIDVNPDTTDISQAADVHLSGPSGELLPRLWERAIC